MKKMVPTDLLKMIAFFEQCQVTNNAAGILEKFAKDKKQPKEKKTAQLPVARSHESSYWQHCSCKFCKTHQSNWCNHKDCWSDYHHWDDWHHNHPQLNDKDSKSTKSYAQKDDCRHNHSKKKRNKAMHYDQYSLLSVGNSSGRRNCSCSRYPSCSCSWSCSFLSNRSYNNHHVAQDDCRLTVPLKCGYLYSSKSDNGGCFHHPDMSNTVFATFFTPIAKKSKCTQI